MSARGEECATHAVARNEFTIGRMVSSPPFFHWADVAPPTSITTSLPFFVAETTQRRGIWSIECGWDGGSMEVCTCIRARFDAQVGAVKSGVRPPVVKPTSVDCEPVKETTLIAHKYTCTEGGGWPHAGLWF